MLMPYLEVLNKKKIILGSQSKTRNYLFSSQNINFETFSSKFAEDLQKGAFETPAHYNMQTCKGKVQDLLQTFTQQNKQWDLLICGDTIVCLDNKIIQKPIDKKDCIEMLTSLSNRIHEVYTAHTVVFNTTPVIRYQWVTRAEVEFGEVPVGCFQAYAETQEPYLHSGGYELTEISMSFIKSIRGSFTAVQGLDIHELCRKIVEGAKQAKWI